METPNRAVADDASTLPVHPFARPFGDRAPLVLHVVSRAHAAGNRSAVGLKFFIEAQYRASRDAAERAFLADLHAAVRCDLDGAADYLRHVSTAPARDDLAPAPEAAPAPFPLHVLPAPCARFATEAAHSLPCPPDFVAVPMLAALGSAIGNTRALEVKTGWTERACLFVALVADPGSKKSPATDQALAPTYQRQNRLRERHARALEAHEEERRAYEAARRDGKKGEAPPEAPSKPLLPRVFTTNATMEALATLLNQNPRGLLCVRDELTGWLRAMNQCRAKGDDRQQWLSFWSGAGETVHRKGAQEPLILRDPFVCVTGCLPPDALPGLADERGRDDGFIHRILFAYPPPVPVRWSDLGLCPETLAAYHALWEALWELEADETGPKVLLLTPDAQRAFADWYDQLRAEMEEPLFPDNLRGPWAKMEGYCARLALILQVCRSVAGEAPDDHVDRVSVEGAVALIDYFRSHARRVYTRIHATREDHQIPPVLKWIAQKGGTVTLRDLLRANAGGVKNKTEAGRLLRELEDRGYGTVAKGERKNSLVFRLTFLGTTRKSVGSDLAFRGKTGSPGDRT